MGGRCYIFQKNDEGKPLDKVIFESIDLEKSEGGLHESI